MLKEVSLRPGPDVDETVTVDGCAHANAVAGLPESGDTFGRYVIGQRLGSGGMGVVVSAYDPKLDRTVALKLLKRDADDGDTRMTREAQALAQLQHPGVINVFEVGSVDGTRYIAMEYVEGRTLKRWVLEDAPSWGAVVDVFIKAGRGLGAAHAAGLVHRDFKPSNVLVGTDGRVRVVDFGIATAHSFGNTSDPALVTLSRPLDGPIPELTGTGIAMGTPAYMAPEQHAGKLVDARSDQYAFCASLFEAVYGKRPFRADDMRALVRLKRAGKVAPTRERTRVPAGVRKAILRGLCARPDERWPSMEPLLAVLERSRRQRALSSVAAVSVVFGLATATWAAAPTESDTEACTGGAARVAEVWNDARARTIREAFAAVGGPAGPDAAARVERWLARYTDAWIEQHRQACRAHADGSLSAAVLDRRMQCLRERLAEVDALADVFSSADAEVVGKSTQASAALSPLIECSDPALLGARMDAPVDAEVREQVDAIRGTLAQARAQEAAGRWSPGLESARRALAAAESVEYPPVRIEAQHMVGLMASRSGELEEAKRTLTEAAHDARALGYDRLAAQTAGHLTFVLGYQLALPDEALQWGRQALVAAERGQVGPQVLAQVKSNMAAVAVGRADYAAAVDAYQEVLDLLAQVHEPGHPSMGGAWNNLGGVYMHLGRLEEAEPAMQRALDIWERQLGEEHPLVATALNGLSALYERERRYPEALAVAERALKIRRDELGEDAAPVAMALDHRASLLLYSDRLDEAEAEARKALTIRRRVLPSPHPHLASSLTNLGMILEKKKAFADARDLSREAVAMWDAAVGEGHVHSAYPLTALGISLMGLGAWDDAVEPLRKAVTLRVRSQTESHLLARSQLALGEALVRTQQPSEGCPLLETAAATYAAEALDAEAATAHRLARAWCRDAR